MSIVSDEDFHEAIREIASVLPRSLWEKLNDIAAYLALIGANDEAFVVWKLAYSGLVPVPEQSREAADCLVTSFCRHGRHPDLAGDHYRSIGAAAVQSLEQRAARRDLSVYRMLHLWRYATPLFFKPLAHLRAGLDLSRPPTGERTSPTELEALSKFDAFIAAPGEFGHSLLPVHLIYADIAYRHGMDDIALAQLRAWKQNATRLNTFLHEVLSLDSTTRLALSGALASTSAINPADRREIVGDMVVRLVNKLESVPPPFEYPSEIALPIFYSTLSLEPADDQFFDPEWELNLWTGEAPTPIAPGEPYPRLIALAGLASGHATIRIDFPEQLCLDHESRNVLAFPLQVLSNEMEVAPDGRKGTVFPNSITSVKDDVGFQIAPGEYDVLARLSAEEDAETSLYNWTVSLSFFPRGTITRHGVIHWNPLA